MLLPPRNSQTKKHPEEPQTKPYPPPPTQTNPPPTRKKPLQEHSLLHFVFPGERDGVVMNRELSRLALSLKLSSPPLASSSGGEQDGCFSAGCQAGVAVTVAAELSFLGLDSMGGRRVWLWSPYTALVVFSCLQEEEEKYRRCFASPFWPTAWQNCLVPIHSLLCYNGKQLLSLGFPQPFWSVHPGNDPWQRP